MSDDSSFSLNPDLPERSFEIPQSIPRRFGHFRIEKPLARGAMARLLLATDTLRNEKVAIKIPIFKPGADNERTRFRFQREARAIATLSHPNICPIYDVGILHDILYLSMPYVDGYTLSQLLHRSKRLDEQQVARILRDVALGVEEAHSHGILHRDLKPSNIMIDRTGKPVVLDFGLARFMGDELEDESLSTLTGHTVGTPHYMSREQSLAHDDLTPASDIFSLGVVMWELLCGKRPFEGQTLQILQQIVYSPRYPQPREICPTVSVDMEAICMRAMAREPRDRFRSMKELARALHNRLQGKRVTVAVPLHETPKNAPGPTPETRPQIPPVS